MGNQCIKSKNASTKKRPIHSQIPSDIQNFKPQNLDYSLPKIIFQAEIYNIQLINCIQGTYSINFQISDVISIALPQKLLVKNQKNKDLKQSKQLRWKLHQNFAFNFTQYEIRTHFLVIQIFGQNKIKVNQLIINLFMIATGPQHHDFQIKLGSGKFGRLRFDFKISQVVEVSLKIDKIKIQFDNDMQGEQLDYSFKVIRNNDITAYSQSSNPKKVKNPDQKNIYRQPTIDDQCQSPLKFRKSLSFNKMIKKDIKSFVQWGEQYNQSKDKHLMLISTKLLSNDINKSFLYFLVWKIPLNETKIQYKTENFSLFCGAQINFNKIFEKAHQGKRLIVNTQTQCSTTNQQKIGFQIQERNVKLQQSLFGQDGKPIGKCYISLSMTNPKFQKQMQACARTQDGIINMTFFYKSYVGKNTPSQNVKISQIIKIYENIQSLISQLTRLTNDGSYNRVQVIQLEQQTYQQFQKINQIIKDTLNESFVILFKSDEDRWKQLMQDQTLFIELLNKLYYYIADNTIFTTICWEIVILIMKRGQFFLQNIGFMNFDKTNKFLYEKKVQTAIKYQNILFKYFLLALKNSNTKIKSLLHVTQAFKAYAYIKIPYFRQKIIDSIQKSYDQQIIQLKLQDLQTITKDFSSLLKNNKQRSIINLDWQKYFYDQIKGNYQNSQIQKQVQDQIDNSKWIKDISKRQQAFFQFTAQLVKRLNELTHQIKFWKWSYFPGYTKIVRGFIVEMKKRKLMQYPTLMIKTSAQLLANQQLINLLMPLIIEKTNSYNKNEVIKCIFIMDDFFNSLTQNKTKFLPRTFNYLYLFKTFKLIIQTIQNTESIVRALILIYDYYQWISPEWRDNITMYLLGKVFFKLFFHWSYQVRIIFYNFLIIKIKYWRIQNNSKLPINAQSIQMNAKIQQRYEQISTILINAENQKKKVNVLDFRSVYEKQLFKKMKNKMRKLKQKQQLKKSDHSTKQDISHKQNQLKNSSNYMLESLIIPKNNIRKMSLNEEELKNKSSTDFKSRNLKQKDGQSEQKFKIMRGNSFCIDTGSVAPIRKLSIQEEPMSRLKNQQSRIVQSQQTSLQDIMQSSANKNFKQESRGRTRIIPLNIKSINTKLNYNIYNKQDHQLTEINRSEVNYIPRAIEEYRQTLNEINKYYQRKGEFPKRQLNIQPIISDKES